jgi:uncharacterized Zn finger protein
MEAGGIAEAVAYLTSQLDTRYRSHYLPWLAQMAEKQRDPETALKWCLSLLFESPGLEHYQNLREVARQLDQWYSLRSDLIEKLEADQQWDLLIEIALEEGDVTRALELLPRQRWTRHDLQVAKVAESSHPQAAIQIYTRRIERIIAARGRDNYRQAASILQCVREVYNRLNANAEWEEYFNGLRARHSRLPALQDELDKTSL